MKDLFTPIPLGPRTAVNHIAINVMECSDALPNGDPSDMTNDRCENYFKGETGIVILEAITPQYEHIRTCQSAVH